MSVIHRAALPEFALLAARARDGEYADCYVVEVPQEVTHADFVEAFYTTWLFKLERFILAWLVKKPSTDAEARALARGERTAFAAWRMEERVGNQLVMRDFQGKTCSWLMVEPLPASTRLYFGSGIVPRVDRITGAKRMGPGFSLLLGFHQLYSRALLGAARSRLARFL
jgi:hypothetical protein